MYHIDANGPHLFIVIVYENELDSGHPLPEATPALMAKGVPSPFHCCVYTCTCTYTYTCLYTCNCTGTMSVHIHIHTYTMNIHIHIHIYTMNIHIHIHTTLHTMSCLNHLRQYDVKECVSLGVSPCHPIILVLCSILDVGFLATPPWHVIIHCGLSKLSIQSPIGT